MYLPSLHKLHMHVALTIEGRDNAELPEQALLACRLNGAVTAGAALPRTERVVLTLCALWIGLDFAKMASPLPPP